MLTFSRNFLLFICVGKQCCAPGEIKTGRLSKMQILLCVQLLAFLSPSSSPALEHTALQQRGAKSTFHKRHFSRAEVVTSLFILPHYYSNTN